MPGNMGAIIGGAVLALLGALVVRWVRKRKATELASVASARTWRLLEARVLRNGFRQRNSYNSSSGFSPLLEYEYHVEGRRFTGNRVGFGDVVFMSPTAATRAIVAYPEGGTAQVRVDPADPSSSVLEPAITRSTLLPEAAGAVTVLVGVALAVGAALSSS